MDSSSEIAVAFLSSSDEPTAKRFVERIMKDKNRLLKCSFLKLKPEDLVSFHCRLNYDAFVLLHSVSQGRNSVTDVADAKYDKLLLQLKQKYGSKRVAVVVHSIPSYNRDTRSALMMTFKDNQPSTFKYSACVMQCNNLGEMPDDDLSRLIRFLRDTRDQPLPLEVGVLSGTSRKYDLLRNLLPSLSLERLDRNGLEDTGHNFKAVLFDVDEMKDGIYPSQGVITFVNTFKEKSGPCGHVALLMSIGNPADEDKIRRFCNHLKQPMFLYTCDSSGDLSFYGNEEKDLLDWLRDECKEKRLNIGPSIWDIFTHTPGKIHENQNGDVACDSYHRYADDVRLISDLGVTHYRFSLSWSRLFPKGFVDEVNPAGVQYYHRLIDALLAANIQPVVTLYHGDLPQMLQELGGWENEMMVVYFNDYAEFCFKEFGAKVKMWFTINQPKIEAVLSYEEAIFPPGKRRPGYGAYRVIHTMLKAHARAWHTYDIKYRKEQDGVVSIVINGMWFEPMSQAEADVDAAERTRQFDIGLVANPIFGNGDYPSVIKEYVGNRSLAQGLTKSRLPSFTEEEKRLLEGTADFFALNHYTSRYVKHENPSSMKIPSLNDDIGVEIAPDKEWPEASSSWIKIVPWGLRRLLGWIKMTYGDVPIYVTENGVSEPDGPMNLNDEVRSKYFRAYINEALKASNLDGVHLRGYFAWSLMDNFEWTQGYSDRFGLHYVDFTDPQRRRTPKASAHTYAAIVRDNGFRSKTVDTKDEL